MRKNKTKVEPTSPILALCDEIEAMARTDQRRDPDTAAYVDGALKTIRAVQAEYKRLSRKPRTVIVVLGTGLALRLGKRYYHLHCDWPDDEVRQHAERLSKDLGIEIR